jgi:xanthine/uracil permease
MGNGLYDALGWPDALYGALILMSCALFFTSPFIAAFSLFGRTGTGVVVGVVVMLVVFLLLLPRVQ